MIVVGNNWYSLYQCNYHCVWKSILGTRSWMAAQLCQNQHRKRRKERLQVVVFSPDLGFIHILVRYHSLSYTFNKIQKHSFIYLFFLQWIISASFSAKICGINDIYVHIMTFSYEYSIKKNKCKLANGHYRDNRMNFY